MAREIPLSQGFIALVDDDIYDFLTQWKWQVSRRGKYVYACRRYRGRSTQMHRFIVDASPNELVDHRNQNTLDNRRCNLRKCNRAQNTMNSAPRSNSSSRYKGVSWSKLHGRWRTRITVDGKQLDLGMFDVEEDGARAYNAAALRYYGEFACLNDIPRKEI